MATIIFKRSGGYVGQGMKYMINPKLKDSATDYTDKRGF